MTNDNTPIIIGIGQVSERRDDTDYAYLSPMDLAGNALSEAIKDSGGDLAAHIDTIAAIRQFEISTNIAVAPFGKSNNPPRSIAKRVGANPKRAILEITGGQGPQKMVGELAQDIANGKSDMAAIVGSEAISTMLTLLVEQQKADGPKVDWPNIDWNEEVDGDLDDRGYGVKGLFDRALISNGLIGPVTGYALFDNARRHKLGMSVSDYQTEIGKLFAPFTDRAAQNPHAASPKALTFDKIAKISDKNRMISHPYLRQMVSRDQVNQGAAIIISSVGKAREIGIAEDKWVYIHASADAKEASIMQRSDLAGCASAVQVVQNALNLASIGRDDAPLNMRDIGYLDLYSCFSFPVFTIMDAFDLSHDDKRGLTLTGGLPFFGGAGNNYSSHAIVEAVTRARRDPQAYALVGANGGAMSKYACGIYSARPVSWDGVNRWQPMKDTPPSFDICAQYDGLAMVESFTIAPNKKGAVGTIIAQTPDNQRVAAMVTQDEADILQRLYDDQAIGENVTIAHQGNGVHNFSF